MFKVSKLFRGILLSSKVPKTKINWNRPKIPKKDMVKTNPGRKIDHLPLIFREFQMFSSRFSLFCRVRQASPPPLRPFPSPLLSFYMFSIWSLRSLSVNIWKEDFGKRQHKLQQPFFGGQSLWEIKIFLPVCLLIYHVFRALSLLAVSRGDHAVRQADRCQQLGNPRLGH